MPERRHAALLVVAVVLALLLGACSASEPGDSGNSGGSGDGGTSAGGQESPGSGSGSAGSSPSEEPPPPPMPRFGAGQVGQCHRMTYRQTHSPITRRRATPCSGPHTTTVAYVGLVRRALTTRTPLARRRAVANRVCRPAFRRMVGGTPELRAASLLTWTFFVPSQAQLQRGARWIRCDVLARSGNRLVPLPFDRPVLRNGLPEQLRICQTPEGADVSCARPHAFRVAGVFRAPGEVYPGPAFAAVARDRCEVLIGQPGGYWQPPSPQGWAQGDRFVRCLTPAETAG